MTDASHHRPHARRIGCDPGSSRLPTSPPAAGHRRNALPNRPPDRLPSRQPGSLPSHLLGRLPSHLLGHLPSRLPSHLPSRPPNRPLGRLPNRPLGRLPSHLPSHLLGRLPNRPLDHLPNRPLDHLPDSLPSRLPSRPPEPLPDCLPGHLPERPHPRTRDEPAAGRPARRGAQLRQSPVGRMLALLAMLTTTFSSLAILAAAQPAVADGAPSLSLSPAEGLPGSTIGVTARGLPQDCAYLSFSARDLTSPKVDVDDSGVARASLRVRGDAEPGRMPIQTRCHVKDRGATATATAGATAATGPAAMTGPSADFTVREPNPEPPPRSLDLKPRTGPPGSAIRLTGRGFDCGTRGGDGALAVRVRWRGEGPEPTRVTPDPSDGSFTLDLRAPAKAGEREVEARCEHGRDKYTEPFTVTAPSPSPPVSPPPALAVTTRRPASPPSPAPKPDLHPGPTPSLSPVSRPKPRRASPGPAAAPGPATLHRARLRPAPPPSAAPAPAPTLAPAVRAFSRAPLRAEWRRTLSFVLLFGAAVTAFWACFRWRGRPTAMPGDLDLDMGYPPASRLVSPDSDDGTAVNNRDRWAASR